MNDLIIIGASGFGREVAWLVERINIKVPSWRVLGFLDDADDIQGKEINGYPVLGKTDRAYDYEDAYYVCAIGASNIRKKLIGKIKRENKNVRFATLIDPSVECSEYVEIGEGTIICAHSIVTVNVRIGDHVIINLDCTVGHDAILGDYVTLYPSVNISGSVIVDHTTEIGTGTQVIQGISIGNNIIVGAGAVVVGDIYEYGTYIGVPARKRILEKR